MSMDLADWGEGPIQMDEPTEQQIEQLGDEVQTVADEILVEVKECRQQQAEVSAALTVLREEGRENSQRHKDR